MNSDRALAYGRVVATIEAVGPAKLHDGEIARIRHSADALFFSEGGDSGAAVSIADATALSRELVESGRWTEARARRLLDDLLHCGALAIAA